MKKIILLAGVLLALTAVAAYAAPGLDAGWSVPGNNPSICPAAPSSVQDASDACDANDNFHNWSLAMRAPAGITRWVGEEFILDVQTSLPILPDWWHLEDANAGPPAVPAGCRAGSYSFSTIRGTGSTTTCKDYWGVIPQAGGTVWLPGIGGPARTRLFGAFARATSEATVITADVEYYLGTGYFDTNHAIPDVGVAPCQGCLTPACIVFQYLKVAQPANTPNGDALITTANLRQFMTWQGGVVGGNGCPAATPSRKATWGQVKSMYR